MEGLVEQVDRMVRTSYDGLKLMHLARERVTPTLARVWLEQFGIFARHFPRWLANITGACPHLDLRAALIRNMYDEEVQDRDGGDCHYRLLLRLAEAVGIPAAEIDDAAPLPTTFVAMETWNSMSRRDWLEGLAAIAALERYNLKKCDGGIAMSFHEWWTRDLGLSREQTTFLWIHGPADAVHTAGPWKAIEHYARSEAERRVVLDRAKESILTWDVFFGGMYDEVVARQTRLPGAAA